MFNWIFTPFLKAVSKAILQQLFFSALIKQRSIPAVTLALPCVCSSSLLLQEYKLFIEVVENTSGQVKTVTHRTTTGDGPSETSVPDPPDSPHAEASTRLNGSCSMGVRRCVKPGCYPGCFINVSVRITRFISFKQLSREKAKNKGSWCFLSSSEVESLPS